jgi:CAAX prenyl protease-like protein
MDLPAIEPRETEAKQTGSAARPESAWPYVAPFAAFVTFLALERALNAPYLYPLRVLVVAAVLLCSWRVVVPSQAAQVARSLAFGAFVFVLWIAPDLLWPGYRSHWLFENPLFGSAQSSLPGSTKTNVAFVFFRTVGCVALVPLVEELFWRGWLIRWLQRSDFWRVPLGTVTRFSFWITVLLFASEHGPYWDVGLLAGLAYNWWLVRTRNLADCMLAHTATNACLSAWVLMTDQWQYWL